MRALREGLAHRIGDVGIAGRGRYSIRYTQLELDAAQTNTGIFDALLDVSTSDAGTEMGGTVRVRFSDLDGPRAVRSVRHRRSDTTCRGVTRRGTKPARAIVMSKDLIATASTTINAPAARVWDALVNPELIRQYMFGTNVESEWKMGSSIVWKGEWQGKKYEDKGVILDLQPQRLIRYTHYSPGSGLPDKPENHHTVTIELEPRGAQSVVTLAQDNNSSEEAREHSAKNWEMMLAGLKKLLEK